jgi:hypothetical protein
MAGTVYRRFPRLRKIISNYVFRSGLNELSGWSARTQGKYALIALGSSVSIPALQREKHDHKVSKEAF